MELRTVELIMAVEDEFGVEIPDSTAETIASVGQIRDVVHNLLRRSGREPDDDAILGRVAALAAQFGNVDPGAVGADTALAADLGLA